ncbi:hypothetical protein BLJ79_17455 [Arthrobacter sp. UCD-GKA]|nr:hypothetical protein BLJ79_17455 [Arthrobacter sp. UCD-GKA]
MAILCVSSVALVGLGGLLSIASGVDGLLEASVTDAGAAGAADGGTVVPGDVAAWPHPVSSRAAEIAIPAHMVIFGRVLSLPICIPQDLMRSEASGETANYS